MLYTINAVSYTHLDVYKRQYHYNSPLGGITLSSNGTELTGLWFDGQKYFGDTLEEKYEEKSLPIFEQSARWLAIYCLLYTYRCV